MILQISDWSFDVDITATMEYSASEAAEHCTCSYCRNFYAAVDSTYSNLRPFLAQFGVDVEAPDELLPYDVEQEIRCDSSYSIFGRIISQGRQPITVDGITINPSSNNEINNASYCSVPRFYLSLWDMRLPWVLNEPINEAVSPANEPSFIRKMNDRLLRRGYSETTNS